MIHKLKTWPVHFNAISRGDKPFELRKNDRDFIMADELLLEEYDPKEEKYTGRILHRRITCVLDWGDGDFGLKKGYCIMGLEKI